MESVKKELKKMNENGEQEKEEEEESKGVEALQRAKEHPLRLTLL